MSHLGKSFKGQIEWSKYDDNVYMDNAVADKNLTIKGRITGTGTFHGRIEATSADMYNAFIKRMITVSEDSVFTDCELEKLVVRGGTVTLERCTVRDLDAIMAVCVKVYGTAGSETTRIVRARIGNSLETQHAFFDMLMVRGPTNMAASTVYGDMRFNPPNSEPIVLSDCKINELVLTRNMIVLNGVKGKKLVMYHPKETMLAERKCIQILELLDESSFDEVHYDGLSLDIRLHGKSKCGKTVALTYCNKTCPMHCKCE